MYFFPCFLDLFIMNNPLTSPLFNVVHPPPMCARFPPAFRKVQRHAERGPIPPSSSALRFFTAHPDHHRQARQYANAVTPRQACVLFHHLPHRDVPTEPCRTEHRQVSLGTNDAPVHHHETNLGTQQRLQRHLVRIENIHTRPAPASARRPDSLRRSSTVSSRRDTTATKGFDPDTSINESVTSS